MVKRKRTTNHHGLTRHPLYVSWRSMRQRCLNKNNTAYHNYGGRGITICDEWLNDFVSFYEWALSNGYKKGYTIDRINNDGNYEPSNCRWITVKEQSYNRRTNRYLTVYGITKTLEEWTHIMNHKNHNALWLRLNRGWSIEDAVCTPIGMKRSPRWHEEFKNKFIREVMS